MAGSLDPVCYYGIVAGEKSGGGSQALTPQWYIKNGAGKTALFYSLKNTFMKVIVECEVVSKKESNNWDKNNPKAYEIEFQVPYDQNSIFHKLSGGTNAVLRTINEAAANQFQVGSKVRWELEVIPAEVPAEAN